LEKSTMLKQIGSTLAIALLSTTGVHLGAVN
jgi:hypothetical protein